MSPLYWEETQSSGVGKGRRSVTCSKPHSGEGMQRDPDLPPLEASCFLSPDHAALLGNGMFFRAERLITNGTKERVLKVEPFYMSLCIFSHLSCNFQ